MACSSLLICRSFKDFVEYLITEKERSISHNLQMFSNVSKAQQGTFNICPSFDHVIWRRMFLTDILNMTSQILKKEIEKISSPYWVAKSNAALLNRPTHPAQTLINHLIETPISNKSDAVFFNIFQKRVRCGVNSGGGKQIFDIDIYLRQFTRLVFHLFNLLNIDETNCWRGKEVLEGKADHCVPGSIVLLPVLNIANDYKWGGGGLPIPHIWQFWYTSALFRSIKSTPKSA